MAEINVASQLSFGEIAKRTDPKGGLVEIFEAMNEVNPVFRFIPAVQANGRYTHRISRRTSLPSGTWRKFYKGSATKASTTQTQSFDVGLLEALSIVDEDLIDTSEDPSGTRRQEDMAFVEGMQQQVMDAIISGTATSAPEQINGLQQYLNDLSQTTVMDGGGSGGTSIYVVDFSPKTCFLIYPPGAAGRGAMGLSINTNPTGGNGKKWVTDTDSNDYLAYCTQFKWWVGFVVRDMLSIGRYANINATVGGSNNFNENSLIEMMNYGRFNPRSTYILCCKEVKAQMQIRAKDKGNVNYSVTNALSGEEIVMFGGYAPVLRCDSISTSETTVS
ncbi:MAG TPA: hypothetical protein VMW24_12610 [Sedimentisphaerales bacterium]|nr:hypothetical protein [Sedimentisphaerales bacterium]